MYRELSRKFVSDDDTPEELLDEESSDESVSEDPRLRRSHKKQRPFSSRAVRYTADLVVASPSERKKETTDTVISHGDFGYK